MAKNLIPEICKMLGVEIGEKFKIKGDGHTYSIKLDGLHSDQYAMEDDYATLLDLLCGEAGIVKMPWKPKKGDVYFTFVLMGDKWGVGSLHWGGFPNEYGSLEKGWVYRTKEEAEAALPKVATEIGVKYEL